MIEIGDVPYHLEGASCGPYEEPPDRASVFRVGVQDAATADDDGCRRFAPIAAER